MQESSNDKDLTRSNPEFSQQVCDSQFSKFDDGKYITFTVGISTLLKETVDPVCLKFNASLFKENSSCSQFEAKFSSRIGKIYKNDDQFVKIVKPWLQKNGYWFFHEFQVKKKLSDDFLVEISQFPGKVSIAQGRQAVSANVRLDNLPKFISPSQGNVQEVELTKEHVRSQMSLYLQGIAGKYRFEHAGNLPIDENALEDDEPTLTAQKGYHRQRKERSISKKLIIEEAKAALFGEGDSLEVEVPLAALLTGELNVCGRLLSSSSPILECFVGVSVSESLLDEDSSVRLNPLVIRLLSLTDLPPPPPDLPSRSLDLPTTSVQESREKERSVQLCTCEWFRQPALRSVVRPLASKIVFNHFCVIFLGRLERRQVRQQIFFSDFAVEVVELQRRGGSGPPASGSGARRVRGAATFGLADLLSPPHSKTVFLTSAVRPGTCAVAPSAALALARALTKMKISAKIAHPRLLTDDPKPTLRPTEDLSLCLIILRVDDDESLRSKISAAVAEENLRCFGELHCPADSITEQMFDDGQPDRITGFELSQRHRRRRQTVFVLEGIRCKAIDRLKSAIFAGEDYPKYLSSPETFSNRMFSSLQILSINLPQNLSDFLREPSIYLSKRFPGDILKCLTQLSELFRVSESSLVFARKILPTQESLLKLKNFGALDAEGMREKFAKLQQDRSSSVCLVPQLVSSKCIRSSLEKESWNPSYEELMRLRKDSCFPNFISINKRELACRSAHELKRRQNYEIAEVDHRHCYSLQSFGSRGIAMESKMAQLQATSNYFYSFNPDFPRSADIQSSSAFSGLSLRPDSPEKWINPRGWQYPIVRPATICHRHPKEPDAARKEELNEPWVDPALKIDLAHPRQIFSCKKSNIDLSSQPKKENLIRSIFSAGDTKTKEMREQKMLEKIEWEEKLVVDSKDIRNTNYKKSFNQIDKLNGMLQCPPGKLPLKRNPINRRFPLSILQDLASEAPCRGFKPGAHVEKRLSCPGNHLPIHPAQ